MDEAAPAAGATAEKKRRLLRRVPTSLLVTLLGIALSAWLLPAFSQQWSDRQKAHDLQAGIVEDMASATARVLVGGDAYWTHLACPAWKTESLAPAPAPIGVATSHARVKPHPKLCTRRRRLAAAIRSTTDGAWSLASVQIDARIHAYFGQRVVTAWQIYSWFIDRFDAGNEAEGNSALESASTTGFDLEPTVAEAANIVLQTGEDSRGLVAPNFQADADWYPFQTFEASLRRQARSGRAEAVGGGLQAMEYALLALEHAIASEVLRSHVTGYSTDTHDLVHNLIP